MDIFEEVAEMLKEHYPDSGIEIEESMMIDNANSVVTPGIQIISESSGGVPVFLSIAELRDMANQVEKNVIAYMES